MTNQQSYLCGACRAGKIDDCSGWSCGGPANPPKIVEDTSENTRNILNEILDRSLCRLWCGTTIADNAVPWGDNQRVVREYDDDAELNGPRKPSTRYYCSDLCRYLKRGPILSKTNV